MNRARLVPGAAALAAAVLVALLELNAGADPGISRGSPPAGTVTLRLLGVNDLHGHLEPPRPGVGGVAWLKAHMDASALPGRTIRVHAGDMLGASPLISSWFHDEPAVEAANAIGFDVGTLGNHEFDEGGPELLRMLDGGPRTGPEALKHDARGNLRNTSSPDFAGTAFPTIAANTFDRSGRLVLPPYRIVERAGARVGFIGVTTTSTPRWLLPRHAGEFRFEDPSEAVNRWVSVLRAKGVEAIVVLAHEGAPAQTGYDDGRVTGPVVEETREMSDAVDVVVAGHSHSMLDLRIPNASGRGDKLVVEAFSYGTAYDLVDLTIDRSSGEVVEKSGRISETSHEGVHPDSRLAAQVAARADRIAPLGDRVVGHTERPLTRRGGELVELVGAAQREAAGADLAVVSPSAIRSDVDAGPIAYAELFQAQAFDHPLLRATMQGSELTSLLRDAGAGPHVSGLRRPLRPERSYSVVASELLARGYWSPIGRDGRRVGTEVEALARYVERHLR